MSSYKHIEDYYIDVYDKIFMEIESVDQQATQNFYSLMHQGKPLTERQASFCVKLLKKYRKIIKLHGLDSELIDDPIWKKPFRILDSTKHISICQDDDEIYLCLKHPFIFKEKFEQEVLNSEKVYDSIWNDDKKERYYPIYKCNLILVRDFAEKYQFSLSEEFLDVVASAEQIWNDQEFYEPLCEIIENRVELKNYDESALAFFQENKTDDLVKDIFLAKKLGYRLSDEFKKQDIVYKVASTHSNFFHIEKIEKIFELHKKIGGKLTVLVDEEKAKLKNFIDSALFHGYSRDEVKVGFRESNNSNSTSEFNAWIKEQGLGGDLKSAKILIFKTKPPKWLMKAESDVSIILINGAFAPSSEITQRWIENHHCVIFLDDVPPSTKRENVCVHL